MEWIVKIGGSLFPHHAKKLLENLLGEDIMIIAGGGEFANKIREYDHELGFSDTASHEAAILSMDIMGILLADLVKGAEATQTIKEAKKIIKDGKIPVLLPSRILHYLDPLKHSWQVTSDSIAFYISKLMHTKLLIATDVDGIYTIDPTNSEARLINEISAKKLLTFGETAVDEELPRLLLKYKSDCYVANGKYPQRILSLIKSTDTIYTRIRGD
ncbi:MAG: 5-(aminomethyl)-3-furanmethanol phosphate kinase [Methanobacteriaceae archaeon]|nr:5-(aminomethyl)-3-furanmethanol phosphate kinase [Methanobacteriaceae archaeon]